MNLYLQSFDYPRNATILEKLARTDPDYDVEQGDMRPLDVLLSDNMHGNYTSAITILLDRGADVNHLNRFRRCALSFCQRASDVALLARYGADPDLVHRPTWQELEIAYFDAGRMVSHRCKPWNWRHDMNVVVLAFPGLCEDLARLVVELTH